MLIKDFLSEIRFATFAPYFHEEIAQQFQAGVAKGYFGDQQEEYEQASKQLSTQLEPDKLQALADYENISTRIREYSASFGFTAGIYCGFKQLFTADREGDGGFFSHVVDEIAMHPRMERHSENYANMEKRLRHITRSQRAKANRSWS